MSVEEQATPPTSTPWIPVWGGAGLAYKGDWAAGTFVDGDIVVKDGIAYLCVGGPTALAPDPIPWGQAGMSITGDEMAAVERTDVHTIAATTAAGADTVLSFPPLTFDGVTPIIVEFFVPSVSINTAGSAIYVNLWDGATDLGYWGQQLPVNTGQNWPIVLRRRLIPSAGTHTFTIKAWKTGGGTMALVSGLGAAAGQFVPMQARIVRVVPTPPQVSPGSVTPVTYGTSLPVSPADGQEAILVDSLTAPTYQWRFRYTAGITDAYKWVFIGGSSFAHSIVTNEGSTAGGSNAWMNLATLGPRMIVPRAGIYETSYASEVTCTASTAWVSVAVGVGDFAQGAQVHQAEQPIGSANWWGSVAGGGDVTVPTAGGEIRLKYAQWTSLGCSWRYRWLNVRPKRVA
jgi:hypothetical protein